MLNIAANIKDNHYTVEFQGHCNSANVGEDLVCCACSTLCLTLGRIAEVNEDKLAGEPKIILNNGYAFIEFVVSDRYSDEMRAQFKAVMTGFSSLFKMFSEFIEFEIKTE